APPESSQAQAGADTHKQVATEASPPVVEAEGSLLGTTKFLLAGWAEGMYEQRNGQMSTFSASFNPIFLWELTPKILFDSRLEIEPSGGGTNVNLVNAQISYLLNDYVALGVGEFFSPSNVFVERFEPQWINKLPDRPIGIYHSVLPNISVGAQVRGGFPIGPTRVDYALYVSNGPTLNTFDPRTAGTLDFNSYTDNNDDKAIGGRVGFLPFPGVEIGYAEMAYRPTKIDNDFVRNLELVFRWDHLSREPSGLGDPEETRWTLGLDYWLSPSTVVKAAYEWDKPRGERNRDAFLAQAAIG